MVGSLELQERMVSYCLDRALAQDVGRVDARISPGFWKRLTEVGWHKEGEGGCRPWTPAVMDNTCHKGE